MLCPGFRNLTISQVWIEGTATTATYGIRIPGASGGSGSSAPSSTSNVFCPSGTVISGFSGGASPMDYALVGSSSSWLCNMQFACSTLAPSHSPPPSVSRPFIKSPPPSPPPLPPRQPPPSPPHGPLEPFNSGDYGPPLPGDYGSPPPPYYLDYPASQAICKCPADSECCGDSCMPANASCCPDGTAYCGSGICCMSPSTGTQACYTSFTSSDQCA